jgi:hypothetical protein
MTFLTDLSGYFDCGFLDYDAVQFRRWLPAFQRTLLPQNFDYPGAEVSNSGQFFNI